MRVLVDEDIPATSATSFVELSAIDSDIGIGWVSADGRVISANPAFCRLLADGQSADAPSNIVAGLTALAPGFPRLEELLKSSAGFYLEIDASTQTGTLATHVSAGELVDGRRLLVLQQPSTDVIHRSNNEADHDPLTELGNRRLLDRRLETLAGTGEDAPSAAILLIDLDRFKQVNDTLGHGTGDALLKLVAERIRRTTRADDCLVRLGGDEFVVLQVGADGHEAADRLARRLVDLLARPFLIDGQQINIGASIGVALFDRSQSSGADLLRHADLALYAAKAAGRNTCRFFETRLETDALEKRELELALRRALGLRQFELHYQPQVSLPDGRVTGFEALIRWNLPGRGLVSPADFIPLSEETGDIVTIGEWALRTACLEAMTWPEHMSVAVNVSPVQFESARFLDSVLQALRESGLQPARLEIEITEGVLIDNPARTLDILQAIRDLGVGVAMDDFGTGYSSLSYLNAFPFSKIKIDQSFVNGQQDERSRALIQAILSLGESLGMSTLAEGVETTDQYDHLASDGCRNAQGYLISRPIPSGEIANFLGRQHA